MEQMQYIFDYPEFTFEKEDLMKRKRTKNSVPYFTRCCAKRANGEQCSRKKKEGQEYCGTHMKGIPHGIVKVGTEQSVSKVEVWAEDIKGIIYYIDKSGNVYKAEEIISNKSNPKVIAKYIRTNEGISIPEFNI
jgi:hypothetical protein